MDEIIDFLRQLKDFAWITPFLLALFPPVTRWLRNSLKELREFRAVVVECRKSHEANNVLLVANTQAIQSLTAELRREADISRQWRTDHERERHHGPMGGPRIPQ